MNGWGFLIALVILGIAAASLVFRLRRSSSRSKALLLVALPPAVFGGAALAGWLANQVTFASPSAVPREQPANGYAGSDACRTCHQTQHASWHGSFHRTMTQRADPQTVLASFDGVDLKLKDRVCRLERRGDQFWVQMPDPDFELLAAEQGYPPGQDATPPQIDKQIKMITGSHHMQIYWVESEDRNGMVQMPWYWLVEEREWIPGIYSTINPREDSGPSIQTHAIWNNLCIKCHSVSGKPNMDRQTGRFASEVSEFGIACEACHGPGQRHAESMRPFHDSGQSPPADFKLGIVQPASIASQFSSQICGQCHAGYVLVDPAGYYAPDGTGFLPGTDLTASHKVFRLSDPQLKNYWEEAPQSFWEDGTCRVGGDEFNGMMESACYQRGELSCLSCHSMHGYQQPDDQLAAKMDGDEACLQCHEAFRDRVSEHTHHTADSSGSRCYNCHQPHTSYALFKAIRSHRIDSPNIERSATTGRPDACNLCHLDKSLGWSAEKLHEWFEQPLPELSDEQRDTSAALLWMLKGDAMQRMIAVWHAGWPEAQAASGDDWQAPFVAQLLDDPYAAVRFVTRRSLRTLPGFEQFPYDFTASGGQLHADQRRAVELWRSRDRGPRQEGAAVLLDGKGEVMQTRLQALLNQRDDSPVSIAE